jgi:hypothetical protein
MSLSQQLLLGLRAAPTQVLVSGRALCLVALIFVLGVCMGLALVDIAHRGRKSPVSDPGPPVVRIGDRPWVIAPSADPAPMPEYRSPMPKRPTAQREQTIQPCLIIAL